jgi:hypothetical protein
MDALDPTERLAVREFYPGYLAPETFLFRIQQALYASRLDKFGLYSAVVVDGIQNMLLQFPLLSREQLLWPALFRMLRRLSVTTVSTFTFFDFIGRDPSRKGADFNEMNEFSNLPEEAQRMLHQLIVSSSDYTIKVEKGVGEKDEKVPGGVTLLRTNTISGLQPEPDRLFWHPRQMRFFL